MGRAYVISHCLEENVIGVPGITLAKHQTVHHIVMLKQTAMGTDPATLRMDCLKVAIVTLVGQARRVIIVRSNIFPWVSVATSVTRKKHAVPLGRAQTMACASVLRAG